MKRTTYVYGLLCPFEEKVFYIGISDTPAKRLRAHVREVERSLLVTNRNKNERIEQILKQDAEPELVILERVDHNAPTGYGHNRKRKDGSQPAHRAAELRWIEKLHRQGHPLTNVECRPLKSQTDEQVFQQAIERGKQLFS